jgi:hypothetical protein
MLAAASAIVARFMVSLPGMLGFAEGLPPICEIGQL